MKTTTAAERAAEKIVSGLYNDDPTRLAEVIDAATRIITKEYEGVLREALEAFRYYELNGTADGTPAMKMQDKLRQELGR